MLLLADFDSTFTDELAAVPDKYLDRSRFVQSIYSLGQDDAALLYPHLAKGEGMSTAGRVVRGRVHQVTGGPTT